MNKEKRKGKMLELFLISNKKFNSKIYSRILKWGNKFTHFLYPIKSRFWGVSM